MRSRPFAAHIGNTALRSRKKGKWDDKQRKLAVNSSRSATMQLHGPLGDPDSGCDFTQSNLRLLRDANQNVGVIAQKRPSKLVAFQRFPAGGFPLENSPCFVFHVVNPFDTMLR